MTVKAYVEREKRADLRAGVIASVLVNVAPKKRRIRVQPHDFFKSLERPKRGATTPEAQRSALLALTRSKGGKVIPINRKAADEIADGAGLASSLPAGVDAGAASLVPPAVPAPPASRRRMSRRG